MSNYSCYKYTEIFMFLTHQVIGTLKEVHMPQNGINHPGITALAQAFAINPLLRVINLNDNTFTEKGAVAMAKVRRVIRV